MIRNSNLTTAIRIVLLAVTLVLTLPALAGSDALMELVKILRDKGDDYTVHGFRSSFRDWVAEKTSYPGEVAEAALAHTIANKVEAAYRRTDYLDKRKPLMTDWAKFVAR